MRHEETRPDPLVLPYETPQPDRPDESPGGRHAALVVILLAAVVLNVAAVPSFPFERILGVVLLANAGTALLVPAYMLLTRPFIHWAAATLFLFLMALGVPVAAAAILTGLRS